MKRGLFDPSILRDELVESSVHSEKKLEFLFEQEIESSEIYNLNGRNLARDTSIGRPHSKSFNTSLSDNPLRLLQNLQQPHENDSLGIVTGAESPRNNQSSNSKTQFSLRRLFVTLRKKIDNGLLPGVNLEYCDISTRRCIALCRGNTGAIRDADQFSLRVLLSFPYFHSTDRAVKKKSTSNILMEHFDIELVPRGGKTDRVTQSRINEISAALQNLPLKPQVELAEMVELVLHYVVNQLTLDSKSLESNRATEQKSGVEFADPNGRNGSIKSPLKTKIPQHESKGIAELRNDDLYTFNLDSTPQGRIETASVAPSRTSLPCPRYCGATFSGPGLLVHFDSFDDFHHANLWTTAREHRGLSQEELNSNVLGADKNLKDSILMSPERALSQNDSASEDGGIGHPQNLNELSITFPRTYKELKARLSSLDPSKRPFASEGVEFGHATSEVDPTNAASFRNVHTHLNEVLDESDLYDEYFEQASPDMGLRKLYGDEKDSEFRNYEGFSYDKHGFGGANATRFGTEAEHFRRTPFLNDNDGDMCTLITVFVLKYHDPIQKYLAKSYRLGSISCRIRKQGSANTGQQYPPTVNETIGRFSNCSRSEEESDKVHVSSEARRSQLQSNNAGFLTKEELSSFSNLQDAICNQSREEFQSWYDCNLDSDRNVEYRFLSIVDDNWNVAKSVGQVYLDTVWKIISMVTSERIASVEAARPAMNSGENMPPSQLRLTYNATSGNWSNHPYGRKLLKGIFDNLSLVRDVQTMSMISCILEDQQVNSRWKTTVPLLDPAWKDTLNNYRYAYADILQRWGLHIERCEILKYTRASEKREASVDLQTRKDQEEADENIYVRTRPRIDESLSFSSFENRSLQCALCDVTVKSLVTFCKDCSHGGHAHHMYSWFQLHRECPTGCGCTCTFD